MKEIVCVKLENEMDLILAHKRTMKVCELTGFSLILQTSVATAVSEIARCAIEFGRSAAMVLGIEVIGGRKTLKAVIKDSSDFSPRCVEPCKFAKRLVDDIEIVRTSREIEIILRQQLSFAGTLTEAKLESFAEYFRQEPPLSPYDELRRKNILIQDFADKIKESENEYRLLTDSLPLMMFSASARGSITYANKWLQDFFGSIPRELDQYSWQTFTHPADIASFNKDLTQATLRQKQFTGEYRFRNSNTGQFVWHMFSIMPVKNDKDIGTRWMGFIVDITAQKMVDQTLRDNRELKEMQTQLFENQSELQRKVVELNRSNYELEQFAHLASHDLQEPLRKLFFYSDVLRNRYADAIDKSGASMLNNMTMAASRMKELINDLLSYSQLQQQVLQFEHVDLNEIMDEIVKELDISIREKEAVIEIAHLPTIEGNPMRLRQLFMNLISNSLKYSKENVPPHIQIESEHDEHHFNIRVRDNGIGFEEEYREKIFGLFERLHTKAEFPGTGIGLSICKRIAELHHGSISAYSQPGEYAVFEVKLPVAHEQTVLAE